VIVPWAHWDPSSELSHRWSVAIICRSSSFCAGALIVLFPSLGFAAGENEPLAKGIQDNSFLIEEAYNQEAGVVQHISTLRRQDGRWDYGFTQEWPVVTQAHQFSYTLPYGWLDEEESAEGIGDVFINYRWQALMEGAVVPAFAPRASIILPTGDRDKGLGNESLGYQFNLPVSKIVSNRVTLHGNAGLTTYTDVSGRNPTSYNLGGSAIYAVSRDFNLMLEMLGEWTEDVTDLGEMERDEVFTVSPGFRYAVNINEAQLVLGLAAPMAFGGGESNDYGVFFYTSFEHPFAKP